MSFSIFENLDNVRRSLGDSQSRPASVKLIAVSKGQDERKIQEALVSGQRVFGENRVQETRQKWPLLRHSFRDIELHLIGPLQTNKVREAVSLFDVIQTVDRVALAQALAKELMSSGKLLRCFIQVNTGEEPQKSGVFPEKTLDFVAHCKDTLSLPVCGLMCIPPAEEKPEPHFMLLRELGRQAGLPYLSMGMSGDYQAAIHCGATHIRVGTAIFGVRD